MRTRPTLFLLAASTLAFAAQAGDSVLLRRIFAEGETVKYKTTIDVAQQMTVPGMGDQDLTVKGSSEVAMKFGKIDPAKGTVSIETTTTIGQMEMGGSISSMIPPSAESKPIVQKGTLSVTNRFVPEASPSGAAAGIMQMMAGGNQSSVAQFIDFPETAVKIGDKWDVIIPKGPTSYPDDQKLQASLTGQKDVDGVSAWVIGLTGTFLSKIDSSKLPGAQETPMGSINVEGKSTIVGEAIIDKKTGKLLSMTSTIKSKTKTSIGDSITIESDGTTKVETKIVK